jgi:hypothetical protein
MQTHISFIVLFIFALLFSPFIYKTYRKQVIAKREKWIDNYPFPSKITQKLREKYPHLTQQQANLVAHALREYFHVCNIAGKRMVAMPSQAVDVAWHEFILFTRQYEKFCNKGLGRFLHHTPAEAMSTPMFAQEGIKRAWRISCHRENISAKAPQLLPTLFAIDGLLNIPDGFKYSLNCKILPGESYCAGHIGCSSGCGGDCGDSSGSCGDSSGCGGGCGGD